LALNLRSCICVASPQSIKKCLSAIFKSCELGFLSEVGLAEEEPKIKSSKV
jgi:hypothetical protein